ncbi:response regulator [Azospirillum sp. SYSU D00513]|uniref:response regulator n=1 Tax=Azospirillum sp. SYSU D00513 TaxID=2812561 RepID=UPI001A968C6B|nr:response regulator [Azospirillum sp. SYSU D00513]
MHTPAHVLLAEDEALVAALVSDLLEEQGHRVTLARNGQEAMDIDGLDPADMLITDLRMPVLDGHTLIQLIRLNRPNLPVIVTTGYNEWIPAEEENQLVVFHKPYSYALMLQAVAFLLAARARAAPEAGA